MSHIVNVRKTSKIAFKKELYLKQALEDMVKLGQGTMITSINDYYGKPTRVTMGIKTSAFQRGIGFVKVGDTWEARADFYGANQQGQSLLDEITRNYQKSVSFGILKELNFIPAATVDTEKEEILITARSY